MHALLKGLKKMLCGADAPAPKDEPPMLAIRVDDQFWLDYAKAIVEGTLPSQHKSAAKLQTLLAWMWTIYTASASIGIALSKTSYPHAVILLIAAPSVVLVIAYWLAVYVEMPAHRTFEPNSPTDIEQVYISSVEEKKKRLDHAMIASALAALLVAAGLYAASVVKQDPTPHLQVTVVDGKQKLSVSGSFPADTIVRFTFTLDDAGKPVDATYQTSSSGRIQFAVPVSGAKKVRVLAEWTDPDGLLRTMARVISVT